MYDTYTHTCIHAYMHTCIHAYLHRCIEACIHTYIHSCVYYIYIHTPIVSQVAGICGEAENSIKQSMHSSWSRSVCTGTASSAKQDLKGCFHKQSDPESPTDKDTHVSITSGPSQNNSKQIAPLPGACGAPRC